MMKLIVTAVMLFVTTPISQHQQCVHKGPAAERRPRMVLVAQKCVPIGTTMDAGHVLEYFKREQMHLADDEYPEHCMNNFMQLKDRVARIHVQPGMLATFIQFVDYPFWGHNGPDELEQQRFEREQVIRKLSEKCSRCGIKAIPDGNLE